MHQQFKKVPPGEFLGRKILQSILSSETLINYNEKRRERSSEGKYTTLTFKALKTRYIALKNDTRKKRRIKSRPLKGQLFNTMYVKSARIRVIKRINKMEKIIFFIVSTNNFVGLFRSR